MNEHEIRGALAALLGDFERQARYLARKVAVPAALAAGLTLNACDGPEPINLPYMAPPWEAGYPDLPCRDACADGDRDAGASELGLDLAADAAPDAAPDVADDDAGSTADATGDSAPGPEAGPDDASAADAD